MSYVLAIDQGTTSSRAILFDKNHRAAAIEQEEFAQHLPHSGWVEHDPADLWSTTVVTCLEAIAGLGIAAKDIAAIGITNQRETTIVWDRRSGEPVCNAIVWQDRRTAEHCQRLKAEGHEPMISEKTGLLLDPYFSGTKIAWILDNIEGARQGREGRSAVRNGGLLSDLANDGGAVHATDATNAARTLLYNIHEGCWDDDLCRLMGVPTDMLPEVRDSAADFGSTQSDLFGSPIPILGVAGDQQAATLGQACFRPGMMKSTYGTGAFALLNTGDRPVASKKTAC